MKLLLTSVFKPYGIDDEYNRKANRMELFHNQITREQGIFSLRRNHRSYNLYLLAENVSVPSTVLDFPSLKRFVKEIKKGYDYIGISFIMPNFSKTRKMAELIREHSPNSKIILGGHGTQIPDLEKLIDCDYIVRGEGIRWLREFFGEPQDAPIKHPLIPAADNKKFMGIPMHDRSVVLLTGVGCVNACRFCSTTHLFDFKYIPFLKTAEEMFAVMQRAEKEMGTEDFSILDENFLKSKERAIDLLDLMKAHDKHYYFAIFSSAETIKDLGVKFLFDLGIRFVWIGVESKKENYEKTRGVDMMELFGELRNHGISILASTILFQEHHDKETIWEDIDYTIELRPDFTQFMQLGPLPQTGLYKDYMEKGVLREDLPYEEWHGQHQLWFTHPHFTRKESEKYLRSAFQKDYHELGPSVLRVCDTFIESYHFTKRYTDDPWARMRNEQLRQYCKELYPVLCVMKPYLPNAKIREMAERLIEQYREVFGAKTLREKLSSRAASAYALIEFIRLKVLGDLRQPKTLCTTYHRPSFQLFPAILRGKSIAELAPNLLEIKLKDALSSRNVSLELHGILDAINVDRLRVKIAHFFEQEMGYMTLNIVNVQRIEDNSLYSLIEQLEEFHSRIQLVYSIRIKEISRVIGEIKLDFDPGIQCFESN